MIRRAVISISAKSGTSRGRRSASEKGFRK